MYINRIQAYILELLKDYGCLKRSQLEAMAKTNMNPYLRDINAYTNQMYWHKVVGLEKINDNDYYVFLPDRIANPDVINAFDIIVTYKEVVKVHYTAKLPVTIRFIIADSKNSEKEVNVIVVHKGNEGNVCSFANKYLNNEYQICLFLLESKTQLVKMTPVCRHSYAIKKRDELLIFDEK